uniref:Uncharacterized protein n=1 Tax=Euplotes crassus TaxID=5936 RepID=A0A7S3KHX0_EUPCR|mmetsp:Transcript_25420/g.25172  ORF Transcript_25420/g.25172 Transcript_25420/m.25172 type:complete len:301 (+) Transcript_25420:321-1223(+)
MKNIYQTPNEFNITIDNRTPKDSFHKENDNIDSLKFPNISRTVILTEKDDTTDQRTENEDIDIVSKMITHDLAPSESGPTGSITDRGENQSYQRIIISESVPKIQKKPNHKLNTLFPRRIHKLFNQQCKSHLTFAKKPMSPKPPQKPSPVPLQPIDPLERTRIDYITSTATTNLHPFESSKSAANLLAEIPSYSDKQAPSHSMNTDLILSEQAPTQLISKIRNKIADQPKKEDKRIMNEEDIRLIAKNAKSYKQIPFSTTPALEQPKAQNQAEILARLNLNEKMKILDSLVKQMEADCGI